jgi:hypothetical protein
MTSDETKNIIGVVYPTGKLMTARYQIFETLIISFQVVIKLFTKKYLFSP